MMGKCGGERSTQNGRTFVRHLKQEKAPFFGNVLKEKRKFLKNYTIQADCLWKKIKKKSIFLDERKYSFMEKVIVCQSVIRMVPVL